MSLTRLFYAVIAAIGGFFAGSVLWSAGTGAVAGVLDVVGIIIPSTTLLSVAPVAGLVGAAAAVKWVIS